MIVMVGKDIELMESIPHYADDERSIDTVVPNMVDRTGDAKKSAWLAECVRTVHTLKGFGPRKLTQQEIGD
jgi:hypothetical protein